MTQLLVSDNKDEMQRLMTAALNPLLLLVAPLLMELCIVFFIFADKDVYSNGYLLGV